MKPQSRRVLGLVFLTATAIVWGSSVILLKQTINTLPPVFVLALRFLIASVLLLAIFGVKLKGMSKGTLVRGIILGLVVAAAYVVQTYGLRFTTASRNSFITGSYCVMCPFLAWMVEKKRPRYHSLIAAALCIAGLAMIAFAGGDDGGLHFLGDGLTFLGAIGYAAQIILIFSFQVKHGDNAIQLLVMEIVTVAIVCSILTASVEIPLYGVKSFVFGWDEAWRIIYLGVICTLVAQMAQMIGQKYTSPAQAGMILSMESAFGVVFAIIIGHEKLSWFLGGAFLFIFVAQILNALGPWIDDRIAARKTQVVPQEEAQETPSTEEEGAADPGISDPPPEGSPLSNEDPT